MAHCNTGNVKKTLSSGSLDCIGLLSKISNNNFIDFLNGIRAGTGSLIRDRGFSKIARLETLKGIIFQECSGKAGVNNEDIVKKIVIAQKLISDIRKINKDLGKIMKEIEKGKR